MSEIYDTINDTNDKLLSSDCNIIECLKKARYIAKYYNEIEILGWVENELNGYTEGNLRDLPTYRKINVLFYRKKPIKIPYPFSMEDIILRSKEKSGTCELIHYVDEPEMRKEVPLTVNVSEFKNIIMAVTLRLSDYIQEKLTSLREIPLETPLMKIFNRLHLVAKNLQERYENRDTLIINDEYDTQDLLNALLNIEFDIIKKEEYNPSFAGKDSRIDFFLRLENIGIEVKKIRDKTHAKKLSEEIIYDKAKYSSNKEIKELYFFIYDPDALIINRKEFITDLERDKPKQFDKIKIIIKPAL